MADAKISALPAVTTPVSTDEFAVNQSGTTKKETRAQIHTLESGEKITSVAGVDLVLDGANNIFLAKGGSNKFKVSTNQLEGLAANGGAVVNLNSTVTVPTLLPRHGNTGTGVGSGAASSLSLIVNDAEAVRIRDVAGLIAGETALYIYDKDNSGFEVVSVGAQDSGGAGYKLLRIPN